MRAVTISTLFAAAIVVGTVLIYSQVRQFGFVQFDDPAYVTENPHVTQGLTWAGLRWAFTTNHAANWHPVTWLSHMLDVELFGVDARAHHLTNVAFHLATCLLLLYFLVHTTARPVPSGIIAAVFAFHPVHVESVAWVSERKDVLSACLSMLTFVVYVRAVRGNSRIGKVSVFSLVCLALMAKPMAVTLPLLLLLVDIWPLQRLPTAPGVSLVSTLWRERTLVRRLVIEKAPLFAVAVGTGVATLLAQSAGGALANTEALGIVARIGNAFVSSMKYVGLVFWPSDLQFLYLLPERLPVAQAGLALLAFVVISGYLLLACRKLPCLAVGWLWFVIGLAPVSGLVQAGVQAVADRYLYLPMLGLVSLVVFLGAHVTRSSRWLQVALCALAAVAASSAGVAAYFQAQHWKTSEGLWARQVAATLKITEFEANLQLGDRLRQERRLDEADRHYAIAVALRPDSAQGHFGLGLTKLARREPADAIPHFQHAARLAPSDVQMHTALGIALADSGRLDEARLEFRNAAGLDPRSWQVRERLVDVLVRLNRLAEAIAEVEAALKQNPSNAAAQTLLERLRRGSRGSQR